jgi:hypothetical protein
MVAEAPRESVTWTVKVKFPDAVGAPVSVPPDESVSPAALPDCSDQV